MKIKHEIVYKSGRCKLKIKEDGAKVLIAEGYEETIKTNEIEEISWYVSETEFDLNLIDRDIKMSSCVRRFLLSSQFLGKGNKPYKFVKKLIKLNLL